MKLLILAALSLTLIPQIIFGQEAMDGNIVPGNPPSGRCINPTPAYSAWTINIKYGDEVASNGSGAVGINLKRPVSYVTEKTNGTIYEKITDEAGNEIEKWYLGEVQYTKRNGRYDQVNGVKITNLANVDFEYLPKSGFLGFDWVTKNNFAGIQKSGDHSFFVFKDSYPIDIVLGPPITPLFLEGNPASDPGPPVEVTAWIDMETRLPAKLQIGQQIRIFTFQTPPTTEIQLPSDLTALLEQGRKAIERVTRAAPRPY